MHARSGSTLRFVSLLPLLAALGACETSSRLGSLMPGSNVGSAPRVSQRGAPSPLTPAPVGEVYTSDLGGGGTSSSALPPPSTGAPSYPSSSSLPPASSSRGGGLSAPGNLPAGGGSYGAPIDPPPAPAAPPAAGGTTYYPSGGAPATNPVAPPRVASAPTSGGAPSRTSAIGNWSVSEAAGGSCRITLSSAPKLDLYGAGTSGCQSKELQRVNAWELSGSELLLYEPGGGVVARMRSSGGGYSGATAKTGAPVSLSK